MRGKTGFALVLSMFALASLCASYTLAATVPQLMNYQGRLNDNLGSAVTGTRGMVFSLYSSATDTNALWTEAQSSVLINKGMFNVILGSTNQIPATVFDNAEVWLGIKVGSDAEMTPRQRLTSVGYAIRAGIADTAGSVVSGSITPDRLADTCTVGQFLLRTASGWQCGSVRVFPNAVGTCVGDDCTVSCLSGRGNCDGESPNGCETDLHADPAHCGDCGIVCTGSCSNGICQDPEFTPCLVAGTCNMGHIQGGVCVGENIPASSGTICRASAGGCDVAETCNGTSTSCPADSVLTNGTICRASAGSCDVAETCNGTSASCPIDSVLTNGTICRASAGLCDIAETCNGSSATCPADSFRNSSFVCRANNGGGCDVAEMCTGSSAVCPADVGSVAGTVCRASSGICDVAEVCNGTSAPCPVDAIVQDGTSCGAGLTCESGVCL